MSQTPHASSNNSDFRRRKQQVLQLADAKFREVDQWVKFFRDVFGRGGLIDQYFPGSERSAFEASDEFVDIQRMMAKLRGTTGPWKEPTKVITVRMPISLHQSLSEEAHRRHTSVNKLCISKLLQLIDGQLVPTNTSWQSSQATYSHQDSQVPQASKST